MGLATTAVRLLLFGLSTLAAIRPSRPPAAAPTPPNIVVILVDDLDSASVCSCPR